MRILRRILVTLVVCLTVARIAIYRLVPIAFSFYSSKTAIPITRVLPTDLNDKSIAQAAGTKLSYLGYDFDVPWADLDDSKTELFPKHKPEKTMARLHFRSGLQVVVLTGPPHSFYDQFTHEVQMTPQAFAAVFGPEATTSDYEFMRRVLEFSPDRIPHWRATSVTQSRAQVMLLAKSLIPASSAETGIFNLRGASCQGFQQGKPGDPRTSQYGVLLSLYSDGGGVEMFIAEKYYAAAGGVTQPEINRIVQSLHRTEPKVVASSAN